MQKHTSILLDPKIIENLKLETQQTVKEIFYLKINIFDYLFIGRLLGSSGDWGYEA